MRKCLDSLVHQTLEEIEVICVNDGSTDHSLEILKRYARADARIRIFNKENTGYGHSVNIGMDAAAGRYIGIVEPDDYVRPGMYKRLYEIASKLDLDLVKADFFRFWSGGSHKKVEYYRLSKKASYYRKVIDPKQNKGIFRADIHTWAGIYKRRFLEKYQIRHNETPGASYQDNGFWFQTFCLANRVYFLDEPYYMYRMDNPGSSVHSSQKVYSICEEYDYMLAFLKRNPKLEKRYLFTWSWKRFHNYQYNLERIGREYQEEFLQRYCMDFRKAKADGALSRAYFTCIEWMILQQVMYVPDKYLENFRKYGNTLYWLQYDLQINGILGMVKKLERKMIDFILRLR